MELENNAYFWQKIDTLYLSSDLEMDKPAGTAHHLYKNLIYPVDYGHLQSNVDDIDKSVGLYRGSGPQKIIDTIVVCVDILKKDIEVKLLMGCTPQEEEKILIFLNQTDFQKTIVVRRGSDIPSWASSTNL